PMISRTFGSLMSRPLRSRSTILLRASTRLGSSEERARGIGRYSDSKMGIIKMIRRMGEKIAVNGQLSAKKEFSPFYTIWLKAESRLLLSLPSETPSPLAGEGWGEGDENGKP
ncbi:MAG TPA: hypothetical protein VF372_02240, partial [Thermodesulfobacteriota bacterium]